MNVEVGQVWEDADSRRVGRTFKIANLDGDTATCEVLTGPGGTTPQRPTAFIKVKRFLPRYYRLKQGSRRLNPPAVFDQFYRHNRGAWSATEAPIDYPEIVHRKPKASLVQECKNYWPGNWKEAGDVAVLMSDHNDFEVSIGQLEEFRKPITFKVKLYMYTVFSGTTHSGIEDAITKAQDYFLVLKHELNNFIVGEKL